MRDETRPVRAPFARPALPPVEHPFDGLLVLRTEVENLLCRARGHASASSAVHASRQGLSVGGELPRDECARSIVSISLERDVRGTQYCTAPEVQLHPARRRHWPRLGARAARGPSLPCSRGLPCLHAASQLKWESRSNAGGRSTSAARGALPPSHGSERGGRAKDLLSPPRLIPTSLLRA